MENTDPHQLLTDIFPVLECLNWPLLVEGGVIFGIFMNSLIVFIALTYE